MDRCITQQGMLFVAADGDAARNALRWKLHSSELDV
jgi:hypothetical protein